MPLLSICKPFKLWFHSIDPGGETAGGNTDANGIGDFKYAVQWI